MTDESENAVPLAGGAPPVPVLDPDSLLAKAGDAAARLEKANKELSALLDRQEALRVEATLAGSAGVGGPKPPTKDDEERAAAKRFLEGTGFEGDV